MLYFFRKLCANRKHLRNLSSLRNFDIKAPIFACAVTMFLAVSMTTVRKSKQNDKALLQIEAIKAEISQAIKQDQLARNDGTSIAPTLVRLVWNSCATFSRIDKSGGGCSAMMRFPPEINWKSNAGLAKARNFLESIKLKYPSISYGDLWSLASVVAIKSMGGPTIAWRPGRIDGIAPNPSTYGILENRLPVSNTDTEEELVNNIKATFGRLGSLSYADIVVLCGAHTIGRCHETSSGYTGKWTHSETTFSNEYFKLLISEKWTLKKTHQGQVIPLL